MRKEFEMLEKLMLENKDVLCRLKEKGAEYYNSEIVKKQYAQREEKKKCLH